MAFDLRALSAIKIRVLPHSFLILRVVMIYKDILTLSLFKACVSCLKYRINKSRGIPLAFQK